jgi:hypothetical protein
MMRRLLSLSILATFLLAMAGGLAACGKRGSPEHPQGSSYPRKYPAED